MHKRFFCVYTMNVLMYPWCYVAALLATIAPLLATIARPSATIAPLSATIAQLFATIARYLALSLLKVTFRVLFHKDKAAPCLQTKSPQRTLKCLGSIPP